MSASPPERLYLVRHGETEWSLSSQHPARTDLALAARGEFKARMTDQVSAPALIDAINRCERALRAAFAQLNWLFFGPDMES